MQRREMVLVDGGMFMGERLTYWAQQIEPCPESSQLPPYNEDGRAAAAKDIPAVEPAPVVAPLVATRIGNVALISTWSIAPLSRNVSPARAETIRHAALRAPGGVDAALRAINDELDAHDAMDDAFRAA